ncbi:hypothetical protein ACI7RC_22110 [Brevibacillus sp. B_LB10_24]|uniref:hypothetical protein n=1 Tax=Brevibacillus sp. B_LB10_24 TaxID=3380645 RepID=UPI0038BB8968
MAKVVVNPATIKKNIIKGLLELIDSVPDSDEAAAVKQLISYLNGLLRINVVTPPTTEIMSIIKHEKPTLYHATRRSLTSTSHLSMLFQIDMNPDLAAERLQQYQKSN